MTVSILIGILVLYKDGEEEEDEEGEEVEVRIEYHGQSEEYNTYFAAAIGNYLCTNGIPLHTLVYLWCF